MATVDIAPAVDMVGDPTAIPMATKASSIKNIVEATLGPGISVVQIPVDTTPPTVDNFDPAPGSALVRTGPVAFDVKDNLGAFIRIFLLAQFPATGDEEAVHDGVSFRGRYTLSSFRVPIANGFRYTLARNGGWDSAPTIRAFVIDADGNQNG